MKKELFSYRGIFRMVLCLLFLLPICAYAQTSEIKGSVIDAGTGEPLIGVSVVQKGTTNGVITDVDGQYVIKNVPENALLVFSYIGYDPQELHATSGTIDVRLKESASALDEVVVIGYGTQRKSVVTAAISRVRAEDLERLAPTRIENVLKGQVSGVQITTNSGQPGSDVKVRIRGTGSTGDSDPLYIVDGMAVDGGIRNINPLDIQSVEVLKDAASAAVYGSRAANGVILITTKSGTKGKMNINYDVEYSLQNPWKKKSILNAEQYMIIRNEMILNGGGSPLYSQDQINAARNGQSVDTDWQKEVFNRNAPMVNHQLSISGGTDKISYFVSFGYFDQEGIVGGNFGVSNYKRWSIRSNNTYEVMNAEKERNFLTKLKVGMNVSYARANSTDVPGGANSEFGSVLGSAISLTPLMTVFASPEEAETILAHQPNAVRDKNGRVFQIPSKGFQEIVNPVALMHRPDRQFNEEDKFIGTFFADLDVAKGLKFRSTYGFDLAFWGHNGYKFPYYLSNITLVEKESQASAWNQMNRGFTWQVENTLTYNLSLDAKHNFTFLLGQSALKSQTRQLGGSVYDLLAYDPHLAGIGSYIGPDDDTRIYGSTGMSTLASYFGRIDYNFNEKYMLQATVRYDGSDKFGTANKWATFPSVSMGWNILNEEFMNDIKPRWFDLAKLRASWGVNGSQNIEQFAYGSYLDGKQNYYFGIGKDEHMIYGLSPGRIANRYLRWEESKQTNIGLDTRFLNSALSFSVDYFKKRTEGMLRQLPIPDYNGVKGPLWNAGTMDNSGVEFELGYRFSVNDFNFGVNGNMSYVKNKLIDLGNGSSEDSWGGSGAAGVENFIFARNGMTWPFFYGWKTDGIFQTQEEVDAYNARFGENAKAGDVRFANLNDDNKIDDKDRTMIGKGAPDWTYGLTLTADWKNFDCIIFFQGATGNQIFDISQRADIPGINRPAWILDRWTGPGTSNRLPRVTTQDDNRNWRASDLYVKDGDFVRLKNMQIGYTLPANITRKATLQRVRIFVGAENLLTFTKYKDGFDPEIADGDQGVDKGIYPQARKISFGANISF